MTITPKGHSAIFLAVNMFTGYVQLKPLKSRKTDELVEAVKPTIILPFGIPKFFRCNNEFAMANSTDFHKFMEPLGVQFLPCSTTSPWSNRAAEQAVQINQKPFVLSLNKKMLKIDGMIICISSFQLITNQPPSTAFPLNNYILVFPTPQ
jgi:hypothetical protein